MAYIGKEPAVGNFQVCDAISVVNGQAAYTMQVSSVNVVPESANHMLVSLNGILQKPNSSFTVSGSTITFASNLATGDVIDFIMLLGSVLNIGTPSDSTVTDAKTNFVTTSSAAGLQIKGDGTTAGALQMNCEQNSHGIKLQSPPHSANQSYTLKFPSGNVTAGKFLKVDSVSGSGTTGVGTLTFADAGGGLTLLSTTSVTSASSVQVGTFSSTYTSYKIILAGLSPNSNDQDLYFRFIKADGSEDSSNDYRTSIGGHRGSTYTSEGSESTSAAKFGRNAHNDTGTIACEMLVTNPQQSIRTSVVGVSNKRFSANAYAYVETFGCWINGSTSHTAIKFYPGSGNWNASGKIMVYGLKE